MAINLIILLRGELVGIVKPAGKMWFMVKAAEDAGFKVYRTHENDQSISELGEFGWKYVVYPPEVVRLAQMIVN